MQLMRNLYLGGDERTIKQKIAEVKLALEYNKDHSKRSILTSYLNSVPYGTVGGQTAIGVLAASRIFFDKPASQLDLEQAALLAGLPQAPSEYNPFLDPAAARQRRNEVLTKMAELHYISPARAAAAERAPLEVHHGDLYSEKREGFFFEYVRQQLVDRYGPRVVERGGLKVYTTLDLHMQELAHNAIAEVLDETGDPASAIVTIDPHNGYIETMAESESYEQSQFNLASEGHRQPGSTFKAIDLADALSRGVDPNSTYYDSHTLYPGWLAAEPNYEVKTFGGEQNGVYQPRPRDAQIGQHRLRAARRRPRRGKHHADGLQDGRQDAPDRQPRAGARGPGIRGDSARNGKRVRDPRRRRSAQRTDRDHQGSIPRRTHRHELGHPAPCACA